MFHIFYGGEPFMRSDLVPIINYCNKENIHYTIITNNSEYIQPQLESLLLNTDYITGLTSSVDPIIFNKEEGGDIVKKSIEGLKRLVYYKGIIKDLVAEITVDSNTLKYLYPLVEELSSHNISSSITFIDPAKSPYYDFSNVTDDSLLVYRNKESEEVFDKLLNSNLDIHMKNILLPKLLEIAPSNLDCKLENSLDNLTIDSDGSVRLCLRIKGAETPKLFIKDCILEDGSFNPNLHRSMIRDKKNYCRLCNWTCMIYSKETFENKSSINDLVHIKKRIM
jgi:MoaA/NifB/PqqE/SkfB family radical SAM enzyme